MVVCPAVDAVLAQTLDENAEQGNANPPWPLARPSIAPYATTAECIYTPIRTSETINFSPLRLSFRDANTAMTGLPCRSQAPNTFLVTKQYKLYVGQEQV